MPAPARTAASEFATPHSASLWQWMPTGASSAADDGAPSPRRPRAAATRRSCRTASTQAAPASAAARSAAQRVVAVVAPGVEEVLGVVDDGLALAGEEGDRLGDHAQVLVAVDAHDLLEVQAPGLADERADRREAVGQQRAAPRPRRPRTPRRRVMPKAAISASRNVSPREQLEELGLLRVRGREAGLDHAARRARRARARRAASPRPRATCPPPACRRAGCSRRSTIAAHVARAPARGDDVEPLGVALGAAVQRVLELALDRARDLAGLAACRPAGRRPRAAA